MKDSISDIQAKALYVGRAIVNERVLSSQPNMILTSLSWPSAFSFLRDIISLRGIMSSEERGLASDRIARGIARTTLKGVSPKSGATPMESSM